MLQQGVCIEIVGLACLLHLLGSLVPYILIHLDPISGWHCLKDEKGLEFD